MKITNTLMISLMISLLVSCLPKKSVHDVSKDTLTVTPNTSIITVNDSVQINAVNGTPPYTYELASNGSVNARVGALTSTGVFIALGTPGVAAYIKVTDAKGKTGTALITVNDVLTVNPTARVSVAGSIYPFWFTGVGGVPPYTFSVTSGGGSISSKGIYTAPATTGSATIRVTDSVGSFRDAPVVINPSLSMFPTSLTRFVQANTSLALSASGGLPPYTWSLLSGSGFVNGATYFAPTASIGTGTVTVVSVL